MGLKQQAGNTELPGSGGFPLPLQVGTTTNFFETKYVKTGRFKSVNKENKIDC